MDEPSQSNAVTLFRRYIIGELHEVIAMQASTFACEESRAPLMAAIQNRKPGDRPGRGV
jgi:hypothetical protein